MRYRKDFIRAFFFLFLLAGLLIGLVGMVRVPVEAAPQLQGTTSPTLEVVINEIAWSGTTQSPFDEWIELYNPPDTPPGSEINLSGWHIESSSGNLSIDLTGATIPDNDYLLLERGNQNVVQEVNGFVYPVSSGLLSDVGEALYLYDNNGNLIDIVNSSGGKWPGGNLSPTGSMERYAPLQDSSTIWTTNDGSFISNGTDAGNNPIHGTPGAKNWAYSFPPPTIIKITADSPDPSSINDTVSVSVSVAGGYSIPTGSVSITGADTNCTVSQLSATGTGTCSIIFKSIGDKTITATYNGDSDHPTSTVTESHKVRPASKTTIISHTPDPSVPNQSVSVVIQVVGDKTIPTGTVSITGASTNCTITLSGGSGDCEVKFSKSGTYTLAATFLGSDDYAVSVDTKTHSVVPPTPIPTRTPFIYRTSTPAPKPPPPLVAINEFLPRPGHDWNHDGVINVDDEYIELLNHGVVDVNLSGYRLDDEANIGSEPYRLPSVTIKPGQRIVFYGSETGLVLGDGGDGVRLIKPNGQLMDAYNYSIVEFPDQSFCRLPDNGGADDWNTHCYPTPGMQNSLSGTTLRPPTETDENQPLCPIADNLPADFALAECSPVGNNIWNRHYWDLNAWFDEKVLPKINSRWDVYVD